MRFDSWLRWNVGLLAVVTFMAIAVRAEERLELPVDSVSGKSDELLRKNRQFVADQIARLQESKEEAEDANPAAVSQALRAIDAVYAQHQAQTEQRSRLERQVREADKELASLNKFEPDEPKPYSFLLVEALKEQLAAEKDRESAIKADTKSGKQRLKTAHEQLDASTGHRGRGTENVAKPAAGEQRSPEPRTTDQSSVALARTKVALRETEIEVQNLRLVLCQTKQKQLTRKIEVLERDVRFSAHDRDKQLQRLAETEADLKNQRDAAEAALRRVDSQKQADLKNLSDQKSSQQLIDAATDAWRLSAEAYASELVLFDQRIDSLRDIRRFWKRRYALASATVEPKQVAQWLDDLDEFLDELKQTSNSLQHRIDTARDDQTAVAHGTPPESDDASRNWKVIKLARLQELRELCVASLDDLKATERMLDRFRRELKTTLRESPQNWVAGIRESLHSLFGREVAESDDASVTVGQLLMLMAYVVVGVVAAYFLSRVAGRYVLHYLGIHPGTATALRSMTFYALCIVFGVLSFQLLHVPMTAFAFVGGAVAIAIGFGGQDIMNNFMSGLILLAEQPIRVGDAIELDGVQGVVLHIGLRSTRLQTQSNHELIVPNHSLLDSAVTNLTLSDNFVQTFVTIGVERDVDVQKARWNMLEIAFAHPLVIKSPRPVVLMTEVDTYWITFQIHFWLQYGSFMQSATVQSQILETISDLFRPPAQDSPSTDGAAEEGPAAARKDPISDVRKTGSGLVVKQMKRMGRSIKFKN